jgi:hypothetical protein
MDAEDQNLFRKSPVYPMVASSLVRYGFLWMNA